MQKMFQNIFALIFFSRWDEWDDKVEENILFV